MTYFERRYESTVGGGPIDKLGRDGLVLCDRCGFSKHHRPSRPDDRELVLNEDIPGWAWDPRPPWCWDRRWSMEPYPCAVCGRDANINVPMFVICDELELLHELTITADGRAYVEALAALNEALTGASA